MSDSTSGPLTYQVVRATWLSQKPGLRAGQAALSAAGALALGSLAHWSGRAPWLAASGRQVFADHEYWRLWTTVLAHGDLGHLFANSFLFIVLGFFLNGYFGAYAFPLMAFFYGGVTNAVSLWTYPREMTLIGASGVVSWMGGAWLTLYVLLDERKTVSQRLLRAGGVALAVFAPSEAFDPQVSYRTHAIGFVFGVAWALAYFLRRRDVFARAVRVETIVDEDEEPAVPR